MRNIFKSVVLAFSKTWVTSTLGHCTFIPENNKTTCFTMKIDLKKFRNGVSTVVRKQISFLCCELFPAFLYFSNTTSCHWLSVNKIEGKIKRLFELGTFTANKIIFSRVFKVSVKENEVPTEKNSSRASIFATKASYISN